MKRPSPSSLPQNDAIQPSRSHYLDFRVGRAAAAAAPSIIGVRDGGGVSSLSLASSPYGTINTNNNTNNNTATSSSSCFANNFGTNYNNGCNFGGSTTDSCSTDSFCIGGWGGQHGLKTTTSSNNNIMGEKDEDDDEDVDPTVFIAKEMNRLSIPERELAYEDMHGVSSTIQETPEFISRAFLQLEEEISKIPTKPAYDLAKTTLQPNGGTQYVYDSKLRLMFLRCVRFHPEKAAKRMIQWFQWKLQLFGPERLCQPYIYLQDLEYDTKWMIECGLFQILPVRDTCNRAVLFISNHYTNRYFRSKKAALQMIFYILMNHIMDDELSQRHGMVYIIYNYGNNEMDIPQPSSTSSTTQSIDDKSTINKDKKDLCSCIPIRLAALHFMMTQKSNTTMRYWLSWAIKGLEEYVNVRIRIHYGSYIECEYALASFGIPRSYFPIDNGTNGTTTTTSSELKLTNHKKWIQRQLVKEKELRKHHNTTTTTSPSSSFNSYIFPFIELPNNNDVLLGQGKPLQNHPGNKRLLDVIQSYLEEYNAAPRINGRTEVARKVIQEIKNGGNGEGGRPDDNNGSNSNDMGGRFLKPRSDDIHKSSGWWEEVTDEDVILEKIKNGFRNTRRSKQQRR